MNPMIRDALQYCPNLPTLPGVAIRVVEMGRDPDATTGALAGLLAQDPALASRILKVSNSPLYSRRRNNDNLYQAVMVLGLNATMTLALSFSLSEVVRGAPSHRQSIDQVWRRALISALASRLIGTRLGLRATETLYLAGLLQDLGILALAVALPDRYGPLLVQSETHDALLKVERELLGTDHGEAGTWLMRHWGLPDHLALVATEVHTPDQTQMPGEQAQLVQCVALAGTLADLFLGDPGEALTETAIANAQRWLGLDREALNALLDELAEGLPEIASLFQTDIISPSKAAGVIDQAREILATRALHLIQQVSEQNRKVLEIEQTTRQLRKVANHDALTGLHNRRHFDEILESEFTLATDNGWPLTLGFLDLDHFKKVNDNYGHLTGDAVLAKIATVLKESLRERDFVMRYGGEEFVVLLPGSGMSVALSVFERLRTSIAATQHRREFGGSFSITTSIGIAFHMDGERRYESATDLVRAADRALYDAKRNGRNRIEVAAT